MPGDQWRARLECADLSAEGKVYERCSRDALHLDKYFEDLAENWRSREGEKQWEALGLRLAARDDGHVTLDVTLQDDYATGERWRVRASVALDAGTMNRVATDAQQLDHAA